MNNDVEWLRKFLDICCSSDLHESDEQFQLAIQILEDRYTNGDRHRYSKIAALLKRPPFCDYSSDQFDMLRLNMEYIENSFSALNLSKVVKESTIKLFDHLVLEVDRINNIDRKIEQIQEQQRKESETLSVIQNSAPDFQKLLGTVYEILRKNNAAQEQLRSIRDQYAEYDKQLKNAQEELKKAEKEISETENRLEGFNTQSVTILSIFTAIVFAFTGGFTMLGSAFSSLAGITRNESVMLIIIVLIIGCILLDIIYFMLNFIGKISNVRFSGNCDLDCKNCSKKKGDEQTCGKWTRFVNRHFLLKCINIAVALIVTLLMVINMFCLTPSYPDTGNNPIPAKDSDLKSEEEYGNELETTTSIEICTQSPIPTYATMEESLPSPKTEPEETD